MSRFRRFLALLALPILAGGCQKKEPADSRLQSPAELVEQTSAQHLKNIFINPGARAALQKSELAFAKPSPNDAAAGQSPALWRRLDRAQRFDGVLLAGQSGEFQPLLTHLAESPDFRLVHVDNWGALFVRGASGPFMPPAPGSIKGFPNDGQRAAYLSQVALLLDAAGQLTIAGDYMKAALDFAPDDPGVVVRAAALALSRKRYGDALKYAARALELHPHDLFALEVQARTYAELKAADRAWEIATELKERAPADDMNALFLHARLSSAAHAYSAEQDSLERLIRLAEKRGLSTTDYRLYLGQCFAHQGLARPALEQFEIVLKDPSLAAAQRADVTTAAETVRARAGALAPQ